MGVFFGIVLASILLLLILRIFLKPDVYLIGKYQLIVQSLFWGIFVYLPAFLINRFLTGSGMMDPTIEKNFLAPPLEELLKGLLLFYLIWQSKITFSLDGALYGFATGTGFAIAENFEYVFINETVAIDVALQRVFSANLVHASSSAILGIALGMFYLRRTRIRWALFTAGIVLSIGLHMLYNNIVYWGRAPVASAFGTGIVSAGFVYLAMQRGEKQAQEWIRRKLGLRDGVTPGEVALVSRLPSTDDLLQPVFERFGPEKTAQVEKLLHLQARLGIKRKFLDSIPKNDPVRHVVDREMRELQAEMRAAQRRIGTYTMLFVRGLYTEDMISVWEKVQTKIREGAARNDGQKGGGLWSSLKERLKARSEAERRE